MKLEDKAAKEEAAEEKAAAKESAQAHDLIKAATPEKASADTKLVDKIKSTPEPKKALVEISKFEKEFVDVDEDAEDGAADKKDQPPLNEKI